MNEKKILEWWDNLTKEESIIVAKRILKKSQEKINKDIDIKKLIQKIEELKKDVENGNISYPDMRRLYDFFDSFVGRNY